MIGYAYLGTSRVLSVSSTTTLAILAGTELGLVVPDGDPAKLVTATATLTGLTGSLLILASVLRFGFIANFISSPVLTGFKAGIGLIIVLDQVPKLLGVHITKEGFFRDILSVAHDLPETSLLTLTIAVAALVALLAMERRWPHSPAPLVIVGLGIGLSWLVGLGALGVATVGVIPRSLPSVTLPSLGLVKELLPGALGIALMSFTETIAAGRVFAAPAQPAIRANRELLRGPPTWPAHFSAPCRLMAVLRRRPSSALSADARKRHPWSPPQPRPPQCWSWLPSSDCCRRQYLPRV